MTYFRSLTIAALASGAAFIATPAMAQATRTWVSGVGDDVNPCSRTAPCKTFAGAISKTAPGGEINCLDPAGFGAVTITKSITIDCTGTLGGILASSTTGVIINGAGIIVHLRGLEINGGPPNLPGVNGIRYLQGASLTVSDSTIYNFLGAAPNGFGIVVNNTSGATELTVVNTIITNNGTAVSGGGIAIQPTGTGSSRVNLDRVTLNNNSFRGLLVNTTGNTGPGILVSMRNSTVTNHGNHGIQVTTPAGTASGNLFVINSTIANNGGTGINADGPTGLTRVSGSTITGNLVGIAFSGGASLLSFGDNIINLNPIGFGAPNNGAFSGADLVKD